MDLVKYIPNGPKNLAALFPTIDWENVADYTLQALNAQGTAIASWSNVIECYCDEDSKVRIHFVNALGTIDAINLIRPQETTEVKSDSWEKPLQYPLIKSDGGNYRSNIKSNESWVGTNNCYTENDMPWLKELLYTPLAWIQWTGTEGQADDYLPIVITDAKVVTRKAEERYNYEVQIEFKMSNENIVLRN